MGSADLPRANSIPTAPTAPSLARPPAVPGVSVASTAPSPHQSDFEPVLKPPRPWWQKKRFWIPAATLLVLVVLGALLPAPEDDTVDAVASLLIVKSADAVPHLMAVNFAAPEGAQILYKHLAGVSHGEIQDALDASMELKVSVAFGDGRLPVRQPSKLGLDRVLRETGRERRRTVMTDSFLAEVAELSRSGLSPKEIREHLGKSRQQGYRYVEKARKAGLLEDELE